jgi:hypothetical protein
MPMPYLRSLFSEAPNRKHQRRLARSGIEIVAIECLLKVTEKLGPRFTGQPQLLLLQYAILDTVSIVTCCVV